MMIIIGRKTAIEAHGNPAEIYGDRFPCDSIAVLVLFLNSKTTFAPEIAI